MNVRSTIQRKVMSMACGALALLAMPACIVQDIHDQMVEANAAVDRVDASIQVSNEGVAQAIDTLDSLDAQLAALRETNQQLTGLREQLELIESINESLSALDLHLESLRNTIENIDSTIPFLKFADDEVEDAEGEAGDEAPQDTDTEAPASDGATGDAAPEDDDPGIR